MEHDDVKKILVRIEDVSKSFSILANSNSKEFALKILQDQLSEIRCGAKNLPKNSRQTVEFSIELVWKKANNTNFDCGYDNGTETDRCVPPVPEDERPTQQAETPETESQTEVQDCKGGDDHTQEAHCAATEAVSGLLLSLLSWKTRYDPSDNGINELCRMIKTFITALSVHAPHLSDEAKTFPKTINTVPKFLEIEETMMEKILVCSACHKLFPNRDSSPRHQQLCDNIVGNTVCDEELFYSVRLSTGGVVFRPIKNYCFQPVTASLQRLLQKPGIEEDCEKWRYAH